jgi:hypothetical protein
MILSLVLVHKDALIIVCKIITVRWNWKKTFSYAIQLSEIVKNSALLSNCTHQLEFRFQMRQNTFYCFQEWKDFD